VVFDPQEARENFLALKDWDCQQKASGDYNLDKAAPKA
jgi:hypothetical protein